MLKDLEVLLATSETAATTSDAPEGVPFSAEVVVRGRDLTPWGLAVWPLFRAPPDSALVVGVCAHLGQVAVRGLTKVIGVFPTAVFPPGLAPFVGEVMDLLGLPRRFLLFALRGEGAPGRAEELRLQGFPVFVYGEEWIEAETLPCSQGRRVYWVSGVDHARTHDLALECGAQLLSGPYTGRGVAFPPYRFVHRRAR